MLRNAIRFTPRLTWLISSELLDGNATNSLFQHFFYVKHFKSSSKVCATFGRKHSCCEAVYVQLSSSSSFASLILASDFILFFQSLTYFFMSSGFTALSSLFEHVKELQELFNLPIFSNPDIWAAVFLLSYSCRISLSPHGLAASLPTDREEGHAMSLSPQVAVDWICRTALSQKSHTRRRLR